MNKSMKMIVVLAVVGLLSGLSLALVYQYAIPEIEINQAKELELAIYELFEEGESYQIVDEESKVYKVLDKDKNILGYTFIAKGNGYQGEIKLMVGLKKDLASLSGIEILDSVETPGLGGEITGENFKKQFRNLKVIPEIICLKQETTKPNEIQAITAATISSKSVVNIINEKLKKVKEILKQ